MIPNATGDALPNPKNAHVRDLADVARSVASIAEELNAVLVNEELRAAQYRRLAEIGEWLTAVADSLHYDLLQEITPPDERLD